MRACKSRLRDGSWGHIKLTSTCAHASTLQHMHACKHLPENTRIQKAGGRGEEAGSTPARSNKKTARHATFAGVDDTGREDSAARGGRGHGGGEAALAHSRAVSFSAKSLAGSARGGSGPGSRAVSFSAGRPNLGTNARSGEQGASVKRRCASALAVTLSCPVLRCCTLCPPVLDAYQLHSLPASLDASSSVELWCTPLLSASRGTIFVSSVTSCSHPCSVRMHVFHKAVAPAKAAH